MHEYNIIGRDIRDENIYIGVKNKFETMAWIVGKLHAFNYIYNND